MAEEMITEIITKTVWVLKNPDKKEFVAVNHCGDVLGRNPIKSNLIFAMRRLAPELGIHSIADVIPPTKRQPNRKLTQRR